MADTDTLWSIEKALWLGGANAYEQHMAPECIMVFPAPAGIMTGPDILKAVRQAPRWDSVEFDQQHTSILGTNACLLAYVGRGLRGTDTYEAFCSSSYRRRPQGWAIVQHQQTPVVP